MMRFSHHLFSKQYSRIMVVNIKRSAFLYINKFGTPVQDLENSYYHQMLEKLTPQYFRASLFPKYLPKEDSYLTSQLNVQLLVERVQSVESPLVLCQTFSYLTKHVYRNNLNDTLENPKYTSLCSRLANAFSSFTDDQLTEILFYLTLWPRTKTTTSPNYKTFWNALDRECAARCSTWDNNRLFQVSYLWNALNLNRITNYNYSLIDTLCSRIDTLNLNEVTHLMYFVNLQRKIAAPLMNKIEAKLLSLGIENFDLDQLGVITLGFFKTETIISSKTLIKNIFKKTRESLQTANNFNITSVVKSLRHSLMDRPLCIKDCEVFQEKLVPHLSSFTASTILRFVLLNIRHKACNEDLLRYLMQAIPQDFKSVRLKDLCQSLFCASLILPDDALSNDYAKKVAADCSLPHRQVEFENFPHQFITLVHYFIYFGIFSEELIGKCLSDEFLKVAEDKRNWDWEREIYVIDTTVGLEYSEYRGKRLSEERKSAIYNRNRLALRDHTNYIELLKDVSKNLRYIMGGHEYCDACEILPHFHHKDVIAVKNQFGIWRNVLTDINKKKKASILHPQSNEQWYAIFVGGRAFYNVTNGKLAAFYRMKCRQLQKIGYNVIEVPYNEYYKLNESERVNYIENRLMLKSVDKEYKI